MRAVFRAAERLAPAVILLDEIDSLLMSRSDSSSAHHDSSLVNEFLAAWDGIASAAATCNLQPATCNLQPAARNHPTL